MNKHYNPRIKTAIIQVAIPQIFEEYESRLTVRQIYYALTIRGILPKTENVNCQVCNQLKSIRECGLFPHGLMVDNTRYHVATGVCPT